MCGNLVFSDAGGGLVKEGQNTLGLVGEKLGLQSQGLVQDEDVAGGGGGHSFRFC